MCKSCLLSNGDKVPIVINNSSIFNSVSKVLSICPKQILLVQWAMGFLGFNPPASTWQYIAKIISLRHNFYHRAG